MENKTMGTKMVNGKMVIALMGLIASLALVILSGAKNLAFAAFGESSAGTRTAQFLKLPVGARYIGMGEAGTAIADDANAIFYNVAGLGRLTQKSAEAMYSAFLLKDKATDEGNPGLLWFAYGMPISESLGSAGLAIQYFRDGDINETDSSANKLGTFSPYDLAVNLSYAHKLLEKSSAGLNLKIISSKIKETATTVAVDLGAQSSVMDDKLMLGFAVQNLGGKLKFETEGSKLPILIKTGAGYKLRENWIAALDIVFPEDNSPELGLGTDYKHKINEEMSISGRAGYNSRSRKIDGFNGVTIGAGFGFKVATFDFAWVPMGDVGTTIRFSVGAKF